MPQCPAYIRWPVALALLLGSLSLTATASPRPIDPSQPRQGAPAAHFPAPTGEQLWYGLYLGSTKAGYASIHSQPVRVGGQPAIRVDSQVLTQLKLLGVEVSEEISQTDVYRNDGAPLTTDFVNRSNGHSNHVAAIYGPHSISCTVGDGADRTLRTIPVPAGVHLGSSDTYTFDVAKLHPGATWSEDYFDPATLAIERITEQVKDRRPITFAGTSRSAWDVVGHSVLGTMTVYVDSHGDALRMEMPLGLRLEKETRESARAAADYHPSADLAVAGAVPSNLEIAAPRKVREMEVVLSNVPTEVVIPSSGGQEAVRQGPGVWKLKIWQTPPPERLIKLPETTPARELENTAELNARNPTMISTAKEILAGEQDGQKAVNLLHDWVNLHMQARYDIGVLRSGTDVLNDRVGVCRDYAVLYTSLARAAGIPTRVCAGLVYANGKFYYHAWAESFLGEWVRMDPTMPQETADATHIMLAHGDARSMFGVVGLVGTVKIKILSIH